MYILRTTPTSPFGRKVYIAAAVLGLENQISVINADTTDPNDDLRQQNPLGKIPTLVLENGKALYDSRVIVQYLESCSSPDIMIPPEYDRFDILTAEALADGLMDAAVLIVYETRFRPAEHHVLTWLEHQQGKINRALSYAEDHLSTLRSGKPHIGEISLACALGFLDFRLSGAWRNNHPKLVAWLDDFARRTPSFETTTPKG